MTVRLVEAILRLLSYLQLVGIITFVLERLETAMAAQPEIFSVLVPRLAGKKAWGQRYFAARNAWRILKDQREECLSVLKKLGGDPDARVRDGAAWGLAYLLEHDFSEAYPLYTVWVREASPELKISLVCSWLPWMTLKSAEERKPLLDWLEFLKYEKSPKVLHYLKILKERLEQK